MEKKGREGINSLVSKRSLNEGGVVWRDRVRQSTKKKFLPTSDVLNRGNEGGTGVQMFLDEPETKEGQLEEKEKFLPTCQNLKSKNIHR